MEKINKFIECLLPVTSCNIKCSYCYVIQENRRKMEIPKLDYDLNTMSKALTKERFGGTCYFSICGAGETLIPEYTWDIVQILLNNGHYVNITTNGTLSKRFQEFKERFSNEECKRIHFAFSFHYLELKRLNLMDKFFQNVQLIREKGCSFVVQLNMCDEYMPHLEDIKKICLTKLGAYPQIAVTRKESSYPELKIELGTEGSEENYLKAGREFSSPLFEFTYKNFLVKRKEFCYAGDWAYVLNLKSGLLKRCYCSCVVQNIFKDTEKPIFKCAVGKYCNEPYCVNSSHFMSLGVIPDLKTPSYADLRNREEAQWYQSEIQEILNSKLNETNKTYGFIGKAKTTFAGIYDKVAYKAYQKLLHIKLKNNK